MKPVPLILLHGCGGSAQDFDAFAGALPPAIRPLPLELPGHGARAHRAPVLSAGAAVAALLRAAESDIASAAGGFGVYGVGLGAFLGLALIRRLEERTAARCCGLFVSGAGGPFAIPPLPRRPEPAEAGVRTGAAALDTPWPSAGGGRSSALLRADAAVQDCFLRTLRRTVVECDITAFHRAGPVSAECLRAWRASTTESLETISGPGWALSPEEWDCWTARRVAQRLLPAPLASGTGAAGALAGRAV